MNRKARVFSLSLEVEVLKGIRYSLKKTTSISGIVRKDSDSKASQLLLDISSIVKPLEFRRNSIFTSTGVIETSYFQKE
jgi:hypothetical protein